MSKVIKEEYSNEDEYINKHTEKYKIKTNINEPYGLFYYKRFYISREESHRNFGGVIDSSDYEISWNGEKTKIEKESSWAKRILDDYNFMLDRRDFE